MIIAYRGQLRDDSTIVELVWTDGVLSGDDAAIDAAFALNARLGGNGFGFPAPSPTTNYVWNDPVQASMMMAWVFDESASYQGDPLPTIPDYDSDAIY